MKRAIIRVSIITILLLFSSSCVDYSAEKSEKAYWDSSSLPYEINYNKEDGTFSSDYPNVLFVKKKADKDFTILNLTDLHLYSTENKSIISAKKKMANTIDELIKTTDPDLITFTGDFGDNSVAASALRFFADTIEKYDIPWAVVFGNHDCESLIFQYKAKLLESYEHCLFRCGPYNLGKIERDGKTTDIPLLGNYIINIVEENSSAENGYEILNSLIFMNTGCEKNYSASEIENYGLNPSKTYPSNYGCLTATQLQWYEWAVESAESIDSETKTKLFVHIPIFGYATAMNKALAGSPDLFEDPDSFYSFCHKIPYLDSLKKETWNLGFENSFGVLHDSEIGCSIYDDFVLKKILNLKSTDMVLCGHDHTNNFVLNYNGVKLVYSVKTGETSYYRSGFTGGTKITIDKDKKTTVSHVFT